MDQLAAVFAHEGRGLVIDLLQVFGEAAGFPGFARTHHAAIQRAHLFDTAQNAGKTDAVVLGDAALPTALIFQRDQVQTVGHLVGHAL